jgi:periplasmic divalent cation tolerance protein
MKERLVACGVLSEATSTYFWRGKMPSEQEVVLVMKTSQRRARLARVALEKMHPYEVPCILSWSADANTSYAQWIDTETR